MNNSLSGLKFFVRTFGCQMNENDSEHIAGILARAGAGRAAGVLRAGAFLACLRTVLLKMGASGKEVG